jgi:hypothetical protein
MNIMPCSISIGPKAMNRRFRSSPEIRVVNPDPEAVNRINSILKVKDCTQYEDLEEYLTS